MIRLSIAALLSLASCAQIAGQAGAPPAVVTAIDIGEQVACAALPPRAALWEEALIEAGKRVMRRHCDARNDVPAPVGFAAMERDALDAFACDATIAEAYGDPADPFIIAWQDVCAGEVGPPGAYRLPSDAS